MKPKLLVSLLILSILILITTSIIEMPSSTPYSVFNTGNNGYSELMRSFFLVPIINITSLDLSNAINSTIVIPVDRPLDNSSYMFLLEYIRRGGVAVLLDENGASNEFLEEYAGIGVRITRAVIYDDIQNYDGIRELPLVNVNVSGNLYRCYFYKPAPIDILSSSEYSPRIIGLSSMFSLRDNDENGYFNIGDDFGAQTVVVSVSIGNGSLIIVSDLDFVTNKYIGIGMNKEFIRSIIGGRRYKYILLDGLNLSFYDRVKVLVYGYQFKGDYWLRIAVELVALFFLSGIIYYGGRGIVHG